MVVECGNCHKKYRTADNMAGKRLRCKECGQAIVVPAAVTAPKPATAVPVIPTSRPDDDPFEAASAQAADPWQARVRAHEPAHLELVQPGGEAKIVELHLVEELIRGAGASMTEEDAPPFHLHDAVVWPCSEPVNRGLSE